MKLSTGVTWGILFVLFRKPRANEAILLIGKRKDQNLKHRIQPQDNDVALAAPALHHLHPRTAAADEIQRNPKPKEWRKITSWTRVYSAVVPG